MQPEGIKDENLNDYNFKWHAGFKMVPFVLFMMNDTCKGTICSLRSDFSLTKTLRNNDKVFILGRDRL